MEMILPEQMDKVLERFYSSVCKQDGTDYEPGCIICPQPCSLPALKAFQLCTFLLHFTFEQVLIFSDNFT